MDEDKPDFNEVCVYKHVPRANKIVKHCKIKWLSEFGDSDMRIEECFYVGDVFIVTGKTGVSVGSSVVESLTIRILQHDGTCIKQTQMKKYHPDSEANFYVYDNRLLYCVEEDVFIYDKTMEDLRSKTSETTLDFKKINGLSKDDGKEGGGASFYPRYGPVGGVGAVGPYLSVAWEDLMLRKAEASTVEILHCSGGKKKIKLRTLNFWDNH